MYTIQQIVSHLPNVAIAYRNADGIARQLLSRVPVQQRSGSYTVFDKDAVFRRESGKMARLARPKSITENETPDTYAVIDWGFKHEVPFGIQTMSPFKVNRLNRAVMTLQGKLDMDIEADAAALVAGFAHDAVSKTWNDDTSDPVKDVKVLRQKVLMGTNTMVLGRRVVDRLQYHPKLLAMRNVNAAGGLSIDQLASIFEVKRILVPEMKGITTPKGRTTVYDYIWGDEVFLCYRPDADELSDADATFGALIELEGSELYGSDGPKTQTVIYAGNDKGRLVRVWEDPDIGNAGGTVVALGAAYGLKKVGADLGRGLSGVLA